MNREYDKIIIGAGLYGLYAALYSANKGEKVLVLEYDRTPFGRATYINQARVHMGYHYPRSLTTAVKSAGYFKRFVEDYGFCIHSAFDQVYATSNKFSWTDGEQFKEFCRAAGIRCDELPPSRYFKPGMCDGAFLTQEYTYDAKILQGYFTDQLKDKRNVTLLYGVRIGEILREDRHFILSLNRDEGRGEKEYYSAPFVLNATYASVNQILNKLENVEMENFAIKYELCEIILCEPSDVLKNIGITVMDGPFFSIMPFGKTGLHSLTSVTFTPHVTSYESLPTFSCQKRLSEKACGRDAHSGQEAGMVCTPENLANCNLCVAKPQSAWKYMSHLADKYLLKEYGYRYKESLYSMKPILKSSEVDDSRPTAIRVLCQEPTFISVLSGKINTVYDLDEYL
ncbi:MAG: FAD-binding oxidoreductase [Lachnospiraceae bacterium]|nr:FAD-binding oxidoreductase [Lachnospiraceae bacterium]